MEQYFLTFYNLSIKGFETKTFPFSGAILGRCLRPPYLFSRVEVSDPRRKKVLQFGLYVGHL